MNQVRKLVWAVVCSVAGGVACSGAGENVEGTEAALSAASPVGISTWAGLTSMDPAGSYVLTADIDGLNRTWVPPSVFSGTLDGAGHKISNFKINDTHGRAGAFFEDAAGAVVKNLRLINITVTGTNIAAGLAGAADSSSFDQIAIEGSITGGVEAGGIVGRLRSGSSITRSYMKGTVSGANSAIGGIAATSEGTITGCYSQATVTGNTAGFSPTAGGIVGWLDGGPGSDVHDVYAAGNVTGRGFVGGLVGYAACTPDVSFFLFYNGIYRGGTVNGTYQGGDVVDANRSNSGGWSGVLGGYQNCANIRMGIFFYDTTADKSASHLNFPGHNGASATDLRTPTTANGGVFCQFANGHCADNGFADPPWNAGTNAQHHTLRGVPGPNAQPL